MNEPIEPLILDLLEWVSQKDRTYSEVMESWRTSCPRLPVWEEVNDRGLVALVTANGEPMVRVSQAGRALLMERRAHSLN